jgi:hypothetical protein
MKRWKNYFSQILNVHDVNDLRQREMQGTGPSVPEPKYTEIETAIEKLKKI